MTDNHAPGRALAANLAARMLDGAGDMTLVPYLVHGQKPMRVVRHGLNNRGEVMVTCFSDEVSSSPVAEVRVDVTLQAPMFRYSVTAASLHALGQVQWVARGDGWVRGVVVLGRVYVHHYEEPLGFDVNELPMHFARVQADTDRIGAYDVVAGFGTRSWARLSTPPASASSTATSAERSLSAGARTWLTRSSLRTSASWASRSSAPRTAPNPPSLSHSPAPHTRWMPCGSGFTPWR